MQSHPYAAAFAEAVAGRDPRRLATLLTGTVRLRALLPSGVIEAHGPENVASCLPSLLADFDTVTLVASAGEPVGDKLLIHYRLRLAQGTTRWDCTQTASCKIVDGRVAVIDLLCSGFREVTDDDRVPAPASARLVG